MEDRAHTRAHTSIAYIHIHIHIHAHAQVHGGSPWGAGCIAGGDGSRMPSDLEKKVAHHQGKHFTTIAAALKRGKEAAANN